MKGDAAVDSRQPFLDWEERLAPDQALIETDFEPYLGLQGMARLNAEQAACAELIYLEPEPGVEER